MRRDLAFVVAAALTGLMMLLIAGHGPWAGDVIWAFGDGHGLNNGDLPVLGLWVIGMVATGLLARQE
ncbi:hypothetical protein [Nocardioides sp. W7]|uniref:hypothetical protein n=1 Tax=Nocardioides sp. W7 TaxID=2931390 RepID=UPI001FD2ACD6|nr:hypothetical protein [Nocardioides sp. W7]